MREYRVMDHLSGNFLKNVPTGSQECAERMARTFNKEDHSWRESTKRFEVWYREVTPWVPVGEEI